MKHRIATRLLTAALSVMMIVTLIPMNGFERVWAEPRADASEEESTPAFVLNAETDGVIVTVEAPEGMFPQDAQLAAGQVPEESLEKAEETVDAARGEGADPLLSYFFDISVLDADGNELQPAQGQTVNISFAFSELPDQELTASVYQILETQEAPQETAGSPIEPEWKAEKRDAVWDATANTAEVTADSFSTFVIEFTGEDLQDTENEGPAPAPAVGGGSMNDKEEMDPETAPAEGGGPAQDKDNEEAAPVKDRKGGTDDAAANGVKGGTDGDAAASGSKAGGDRAAADDPFSEYWNEEKQQYNLPSGTYTLTEDCAIRGRIYIGTSAEVTIDLGGRTLSRTDGGETNANGGVIGNYGTLTVKNGTITGGKASYGGGIFNFVFGELYVEDVAITGNTATNDGGGIYCDVGDGDDESKVTITGATITGNTAGRNGGGIYCDGTLVMSGKVVVENNGSTNLYLESGRLINVGGVFDEGSSISVTGTDYPCYLTSGLAANGNQSIEMFSLDNAPSGVTLVSAGGELYARKTDTTVNSWEALQTAVNAAPNGTRTVIGLSADCTASKDQDRIKIPKNKIIDLDLAGYKLDRNRTSTDSDGHVIEVFGKLTVVDSSASGSGKITGGYAKRGGGINISEDGECIFRSGHITGNRASTDGGGVYVHGTFRMSGGSIDHNEISENEVDGGGIYVDGGDGAVLEMTGGSIDHNYAYQNNTSSKKEYGGDGGGICATKGASVKISNVTFASNWSRKRGAAIYTTASATISNCSFDNNSPMVLGSTKEEYDPINHYYYYRFNDTYDGGAIYIGNASAVVNIDNSKFEGNHVENYALQYNHGSGGAIYLDKGKLNIKDSSFRNNKSWEGGAIYSESDTTVIVDNTTFKDNNVGITKNYSDSMAPKKIPVGSRTGGAIASYGKLILRDCAFTGNYQATDTDDAKGGAIYSDDDLTMERVTLTGNKGRNGGAVYLNDGQPNFTDCTIKENSAEEKGGGVYVKTSKAFNVKGKMTISDNSASSGNDVYLPSGKYITLTGPLTGSDIGVALEKTFGQFSKNFSTYHSGDIPITYFYSCDGYEVVLEDGEGHIRKGDLETTGKFINWKDRISYNANRLSGPNWMSGVSGERYLNEINIPGTHDTSMKNVSGKGCLAGSIGVWQATTQKEYLFEQLEHGARFLDIRMKTYYCSKEYNIGAYYLLGSSFLFFIPVVGIALGSVVAFAGGVMLLNGSVVAEYKDDGENLWACHGRSAAGTYFALDDHDQRLSVAMELEWIKEFLKEHPTETIIIDARPETDKSGGEEYYGPLERLKGILEELSAEKNPSTGESYVYWEDGIVGKKSEHWPKLKDCRGKIVFFGGKGEAVADTIGGIWKNTDNIKSESGPGGFQDGKKRAENLKTFIETQEKLEIPKNAMYDQLEKLYWVKMNTTDTMFIQNPVELAEQYVLPTVLGSGGLVNESKKGRYFGWFSMDGARANHYRDVWITNFPDDLDYCTVTVKSGLSGSDAPKDQQYKLLRGSTIPIPGCIYEGTRADRFTGWKAVAEGETGSTTYTMNNTYRIEKNVTFTAQWSDQIQTPVTVVWKDADDLDGIRPDKLKISGFNDSSETVEIEADGDWTVILSGNLTGEPSVKAVDGYDANVEGGPGKEGYTITMTHTPDVKVDASGTIAWDDRNDMDRIRPDSVTLHLYANGVEVASGTADKGGGWSFDLGEYPRYKDGELVAYKLIEDEIEVDEKLYGSGYMNGVEAVMGEKNAITGFNVTNTHEVTTSVMYARIEWDDENDAEGERPDSVTVRWLKNGEPYGDPIVVAPDDEGEWVVGLELTSAEMQAIGDTQKAIFERYEAGEMSEEEFVKALEGTMAYSIEQDPVEGYTTAINWKEGESTETGSTDSYIQILNTYGKHSLTFYKDTEGTEVWQKHMLNDGTSLDGYSEYGTEEPNTLEKEGYTFAGWASEPNIVVDSYRDKNGELDPKLEGKLFDWDTNISEDMNAYPIWIRDRLKVVIDPDADGVDIDEAQSLEFTTNIDEKIVMRYLAKAARDGYELDGWYTSGGVLWNGENWKTLDYVTDGWTETAGWGMTPEYCDKNEAGDPVIHTDADRRFNYYTVTLTAHWIPKEVALMYDTGDHAASGAAVPDSSTLTLGSMEELAAAPDASSEYLFTGWKAPDGKLYSAGGTFLFDDWAAQVDPDSDPPSITMTAQYEEKAKVMLIFDANGGTAVKPVTEYEGNSVDLNESRFSTARTGYDFDGWYNSAGDKCEGTYAFTANETLTAHWKVKEYKITFDTAGGSDVETIRQDFGTEITAPEDPTKDHYTFAGWVPALPDTMPAGNLTVKASWDPISYKITFDTDGGSEVAEIVDIYGAPVTAPEDPVKNGCAFRGWMDENDELADLPSYMPDTDPTYKAKWHQHSSAAPVRENEIKPTCVKKGSYDEVTYCIECREELTRKKKTTPATGHKWGEWKVTKKATETKEGKEIRICSIDAGHKEERSIPVTGHTHQLTKTAARPASCTKGGNIEYWTCSKGEKPCGRYFADSKGRKEINKEDTVLRAKGHKWGKWKKLDSKQHQRVCANDRNHVQKAEHTWDAGKVTKKATEKSEGVRTYTCTGCKATKTAAIPKLKPSSEKSSDLLILKMKAKGKKGFTFTWNKIKGAEGYDIFFSKCGETDANTKVVKTIRGNKTFKWTKKGLKKKKAYKAYAKAWKMKNGKKTYIKRSPTAHAYTTGWTKRYTNPKSVQLDQTSLTLKMGGTFTIKGKVKKLRKKKKLIPKGHAKRLRYLSSAPSVASVSSAGKITARSRGICKIYVIAPNGASKTISVTVR